MRYWLYSCVPLVFSVFLWVSCTNNELVVEDMRQSSWDKVNSVSPNNELIRDKLFSFPSFDDLMELSYKEKIELCQIPEDLLTVISTEDLAELCLTYPFLYEAYAGESIIYSLNVLLHSFNGFTELLKREDCVAVLLEVANAKIQDFKSLQYNDPKEALLCRLLPYFFSLDDIYSSTPDSVLREKISLCIEEWNTTLNLNADDLSLAYSSIPTYTDGQHYPLKTPFGTEISSAEYHTEHLNEQAKADYAKRIASEHPTAIILGEATTTYNCHFYAWSGFYPQLKLWVADPSDYWGDGSYEETSSSDPDATIIFYHNGTNINSYHSGILQADGSVISKWGAQCLVRHSKNDIPMIYGSSHKYYKKHALYIQEKKSTVTMFDIGYPTMKTLHLIGLPEGASVVWSVDGNGSIYSGQGTETVEILVSGNTEVTAVVTTSLGGVLNCHATINVAYSFPRIKEISFLSNYDSLPDELVLALVEHYPSSFTSTWTINKISGSGNASLGESPYWGDASLATYMFDEMKLISFNPSATYNLVVSSSNSTGLCKMTIPLTYNSNGFSAGTPVIQTTYYETPGPPPFPPPTSD